MFQFVCGLPHWRHCRIGCIAAFELCRFVRQRRQNQLPSEAAAAAWISRSRHPHVSCVSFLVSIAASDLSAGKLGLPKKKCSCWLSLQRILMPSSWPENDRTSEIASPTLSPSRARHSSEHSSDFGSEASRSCRCGRCCRACCFWRLQAQIYVRGRQASRWP